MTPLSPCTTPSRGAAAVAGGRSRDPRRAAAARRARRLLDERAAAAGAAARAAAARRRRRASATSWPRDSAPSLERTDVAGPGFLNLYLSDEWFVARARRTCSPPATRFGARDARPRRRGQRRVRLGQPDRAAAHRPRPPGGLRRHALAAARVPRPRRDARVLHQRLRQPDRPARPSRCARSRSASRCRRTATTATTSATLVPAERARELDLDALGREATATPASRGSARRSSASASTSTSGSPSARCTSRGAVERVLDAARRARRDLHARTARCGCARRAHGDDKDRVLVRSTGEHTYFTSDIAYLEDKRERGFERLDLRLGRRPPRLHRADAGGLRGARRRPRGGRDRDPAVRAPDRRRGPHRDVQARGRVRHARRARRRDRRRRGALLPARALARHDRRPRSRPRRARRAATTPSTTCSTRTRGSPRCSTKAGAGARRGGARRASRRSSRCTPSERALLKRLVAFPAELADAAERRAPHRIAGYALELAQEFTAFYRDCRVRRRGAARRPSRGGSRCRSRRSGRSRRALGLLGVGAPAQM